MNRHRRTRSARAALVALFAALCAVLAPAAPARAETIDQMAAGLKKDPLYVTSAATKAFSRSAQVAVREALTRADPAIRVAVVRAGLLTNKQQADQFIRQIQQKVGAGGTYAVVTTDGRLYAISNVLNGRALTAISNRASRNAKEIDDLIIEFATLTTRQVAAARGAPDPTADDGAGVGTYLLIGVLSVVALGGVALLVRGLRQRKREQQEQKEQRKKDKRERKEQKAPSPAG